VSTVSYQPADRLDAPQATGRNLGELRPPSAALPDLIALDTVDHFHLADRGGLLSAVHMAR
jgi:hypothetical protein